MQTSVLLMLIMIVQMCKGQNQVNALVFAGTVKPADSAIPLKGLYRACIDISDHKGEHIMQVVTDDSGRYRFELTPGRNLNCITLTIHARSGQKPVTLDSLCPYAFTRTRSGYYDTYATFCLDTFLSQSNHIDFLMVASYEAVPGFGTVYFEKGKTTFSVLAGQDSATICKCMAAFLLKHLGEGRVLQIELQGNAGSDEAPGLALDRAMKLRNSILQEEGTAGLASYIQISAYKAPETSTVSDVLSMSEAQQAYWVRCLVTRIE